MGFIWRVKKTGVYQYTGKKNGKRKTETLKTKNPKDAKIRARQKAREWEDTIDEELVLMSVYEFLDYCTKESKTSKAEGSHRNEESCVRIFKEHFTPDVPMLKFTQLDANTLINSIAERTRKVYGGDPIPISAHRTNGYIRTFRTMWKKAVALKIAKENVFLAVSKRREPKRPPNPLKPDEIEAFFRVLYERYPAHAEIMTFYMYTGLRRSEALNLTWEKIDFDRCVMEILGKGEKTRFVPLLEVPRKILLRREKAGLERPFSDAPESDRISHIFSDTARLAGIRHKLHDLRKTFATFLAKNNVSYFFILNWLGWTDDKVARDYYIALGDDETQLRVDGLGKTVANRLKRIGSGIEKKRKAESEGRPKILVSAAKRSAEYRKTHREEVLEKKRLYREKKKAEKEALKRASGGPEAA